MELYLPSHAGLQQQLLCVGLKIVLWIYCVALSKTSESMMVTPTLPIDSTQLSSAPNSHWEELCPVNAAWTLGAHKINQSAQQLVSSLYAFRSDGAHATLQQLTAYRDLFLCHFVFSCTLHEACPCRLWQKTTETTS